MRFTFTIITIINYDHDDDGTQFIIAFIVAPLLPEGKADLDSFIASAM